MEHFGEGDFIVTKIYYDSPREDCNGYYEDEFCFPTLKEAIKAYYDWRDRADGSDPVGFYVNFEIPREIRMKHDDLEYEVRTLGGRCLKRFNWLSAAVDFCRYENKTALALYRIDCTPELRAKIVKDFRCKVYAL